MKQLTLLRLDPEVGLTCAYGEPWLGEHPLCDQEVVRACARFDAAVDAGIYDVEGYRPSERAALAKKRHVAEPAEGAPTEKTTT